jgi:pyridoxamine 5'-phosphate oxidase
MTQLRSVHARLDPQDPQTSTFALATVDAHGQPSVRLMQLASIDHGFVFFTCHDSRKGSELAANSRSALCLSWLGNTCQIRAEGVAGRLIDVDSDAYFATMPRKRQLAIWASTQSQPIADRLVLEGRLREASERFAGQLIPRPSRWGCYRIVPDDIELWRSHSSDLHDRLRYRRIGLDAAWTVSRLAP